MKKIIGIMLIIIGTGLIFWSYDVYNSASSQFTRFFSGETPLEAYLGLIGGSICILLGIARVK